MEVKGKVLISTTGELEGVNIKENIHLSGDEGIIVELE
jgi:hypothetical protein